jgi:hypothetical protein
MTIAQGVAKELRAKRQTAKGALAGASGGFKVRRTSASFELQKEAYTTEDEITSTRQLLSVRHGVKLVNGQINGILSPGSYADFLSALLRKDFAAGGSSGAISTVAATATAPHFVRSSGSWLTDGFKVGQVVRCTGWATTAVGNNSKNFLVTALTATQMTVAALDGSAVSAKAAGDSVTFTTPGKLSYVPDSGHTNIYYTFEEWYSDAAVSERNIDCKIASAALSLPGSGNATIQLSATGLDQTSDVTAYFTSPTAESTTDALAAANGLLVVNGSTVAVVTDLSITIDGRASPADGVVGTNLRPDVFSGKVAVSGSFTAYFEGGTIPDLFIDETETSIISALTSGSAADADFITLAIPRVKLSSSTPDDGETGLKRTYQFTAMMDTTGGAAEDTHKTTIMIHDSQAA